MSNSNSSSKSTSSGIGFFGLLAVAFIVLKLTGVIGWSWWWVTAPLWAPFTVALLVIGMIFVVGLIASYRK